MQAPVEIVHWSWLAASDGEVWAKMIESFNQAHQGKGLQIKMELVPEEQSRDAGLQVSTSGSASPGSSTQANASSKCSASKRFVPYYTIFTAPKASSK